AFLKRFYYAPPLAFWRAIEARALGDGPLASPSLDIGAHDGAFAATWLLDRPPIDVGLDIEPVATADTRRAYRTLIAGDAQALPQPRRLDPAVRRGRDGHAGASLLSAAGGRGLLGPLGQPLGEPDPEPSALFLDRFAKAPAGGAARILVQALHAVAHPSLRASSAGAGGPERDRRVALPARRSTVGRGRRDLGQDLAVARQRHRQRRRPRGADHPDDRQHPGHPAPAGDGGIRRLHPGHHPGRSSGAARFRPDAGPDHLAQPCVAPAAAGPIRAPGPAGADPLPADRGCRWA